MPDAVAAHFAVRGFPATIRRRLGGQSGVRPETRKQPVTVEAEQIILVPQHRVLERAVQQAHLRKRKRLRRQRHRVTGRLARRHGDRGLGKSRGDNEQDY